jgi:hypothetical protein
MAIYEFMADELSVSVRKSDNSPKITLQLGEYQAAVAGQLLTEGCKPEQLFRVTIEPREQGVELK